MGDYDFNFDFDFDFSNSTSNPCYLYDNCTELIFEEAPVTGWRHWFALVCFGLVFLLGVPGNGLVVWVTAFRMPRSVNALWFLNLALADLLCCLSLPLLMVPLAQDEHWPYGSVACKLLKGLLYMMMYCSVFLLVLISLDRWLLVSKPAWCQNWRHPKWAIWACLSTWFVAFLGSLPQFPFLVEQNAGKTKKECVAAYDTLTHAWSVTIFRFVSSFLVPFLVIAISHWTVYQRASKGPGRRQNDRSARTLRVILAVVLSFFFCWVPLHLVDILQLVLYKEVGKVRADLRLAHVLAVCLAYFNSCLNPLLYVCLGKGFRESVTRTLRSVLHFASEVPTTGVNMTGLSKSTTDTYTLVTGKHG